MEIDFFWVDSEQDDDGVHRLHWPESLRVPVSGETVILATTEWTVDRVQWELHNGSGDDDPTVTIYLHNVTFDR